MRAWAAPLLFLALACGAAAETLPPDGGIVNVRDYGARGDGRHDDTAALLRAIAASGADTGRTFWQDRIIYLPDGVYRLSATLLKRYANGGFASGMILMGESEAHTVIRLADHAPGFGDPAAPRPMIFTSSKLLDGTPTSGGKDYTNKGEGNDAYMNSLEDLTLDVGKGNPGAIAIDYLANNLGEIAHVTLTAPTGSGLIGLSMTRKWPGPALIRDLTVHGFACGIATSQTEYGLTFENILLDGQSVALRNDQNVLALRDLVIRGKGRAIVNKGAKGFIALENARIETPQPAGDHPAFDNQGVMVLRNLALAPPGASGRRFDGVLTGAQWISKSPPSWLPALNPVPAPPQAGWVNAMKFGAVPDPSRDSTDGLRRAFASGAATIYLPHGIYAISDSIAIPASVRRITGLYSTIQVLAKRQPGFQRSSGMFDVSTGGEALAIEKLTFDNTNQGRQLGIAISGPRDVLVRDVVAAGVDLLDRKATGGRLFVQDVCCGRMQIAGPQPVQAEQFDTEGGGVRIVNLGSPLRLLGLKTEGIATILDNRAGAHSDIFGGLVYMVREGPPLPAFLDTDGWLSASFAEESLRPGSHYDVYLAGRKTIAAENFPARGLGRFVPMLSDGPGDQ
jgi:hypothetical protein